MNTFLHSGLFFLISTIHLSLAPTSRVTLLPIEDNQCIVRGLVLGRGYEFAVAAVNEAGTGEWCQTDGELRPHPPAC